MPKKGVLSKEKLFPATKDVFRDTESGISWECLRSCGAVERNGVHLRFALLVGYHPDCGDGKVPIPKSVCTRADVHRFLEGVDTILRMKGERQVTYRRNDAGNYEEVV